MKKINKMKRLFYIFAIIVVFFIGRDLYRWHETLQRIERISQLKGKTLQEALSYLEVHQDDLAISDVTEYNDGENQRLIVSLNKVSFAGVLVYMFTGPDSWLSKYEISGLLNVSIENERIGTCWPIE